MKGTLILFLGSVLALLTTGSSEGSREPIFKLTQTDTRLRDIVRQIDELEQLNRTKNRHIAAFAVRSGGYMDYSFEFSSELDSIYRTIISWIEHLYDYIGKFENARYENDTLINYAESRLSDERKENSMEKLHAFFFGSEDLPLKGRNLLKYLADGYQKYPNRLCRTPQSPQQHLYSLYVDIVLTELKFLAMLEWSWLLLEQFDRTAGFAVQQDSVREGYTRRINRAKKLIKDQMGGADQTVWRCDPVEPKAGVTYDEVTRLLQGYIENEVSLSPEKTCRHDCAHYQSARSEGCTEDALCSKQPRCSGRLHNCRFVESSLQVCQSQRSPHRRYEFIEDQSGRHMGPPGGCSRQMDKAKSWTSWFVKCHYCFCLCDEEGPQSDRYFNLRPVIADVERNRVVTGLRFRKHNRIFHLQIQEAELLTHTTVNTTTLQWKPLDSYSVLDKDVEKDVDFHVMSYEERSIDLVEVKERSNFVVTGVRFRVVEGHLYLEAQFTGFDVKRGRLTEPSYWLSVDSKNIRRKLALENSKSTSSESHPSDMDQYVEFTNSGLKEDAAQTTVPFIDIQAVVSEPPVPLSGVGVYYRGSRGHGGYVAPKLITYDFSDHIELPTE